MKAIFQRDTCVYIHAGDSIFLNSKILKATQLYINRGMDKQSVHTGDRSLALQMDENTGALTWRYLKSTFICKIN